jgi:hypothetical protein
VPTYEQGLQLPCANGGLFFARQGQRQAVMRCRRLPAASAGAANLSAAWPRLAWR